MYLNWIGGNEDYSGETGYRQLLDLVYTRTISDKYSIGLNAAQGFVQIGDNVKTWGGVAFYQTITMNDNNASTLRVEFFDDTNQLQYMGTSYYGLTLTHNIILANGHLILKPELRYDNAKNQIYFTKNGNDQISISLGIASKF